jgi:hypothetical protein
MNNFIKGVIEEKFASKAQQRYFYAQAGKGGKKGKKWSKWAKEFSDKTDYEKIPNKVEKEEDVDEIVDAEGNIARGKKPANINTKGVTDDWTTDDVVKAGRGNIGRNNGTGGLVTSVISSLQEIELTKRKLLEVALDGALGAEETILKNTPYKKAEKYMEKHLGLDDDEAEERLEKMGYDENLPEPMVRLVENPKKFMEEYLESIIKNKTKQNDVLEKEKPVAEPKEVGEIVKRQLKSLKNTMDSHNLSMETIVKYLSDAEVNLK